ncbi:hypothetical protein [Natrinema soli]|uniref:Uncharacterized protein n=1 Tax=Natrinema soli TaxID=1930624 RepID=A0ABD5SGJ9_9EURY
MSDSVPSEADTVANDGGAAQISNLDYHSENYTVAQTCTWTANVVLITSEQGRKSVFS